MVVTAGSELLSPICVTWTFGPLLGSVRGDLSVDGGEPWLLSGRTVIIWIGIAVVDLGCSGNCGLSWMNTFVFLSLK